MTFDLLLLTELLIVFYVYFGKVFPSRWSGDLDEIETIRY